LEHYWSTNTFLNTKPFLPSHRCRAAYARDSNRFLVSTLDDVGCHAVVVERQSRAESLSVGGVVSTRLFMATELGAQVPDEAQLRPVFGIYAR
jgi:hypothetical protein